MKLSTPDHPSSGTRMPLSRFSYTEGPLISHARLTWTHINGDGNLFCEMEQYVGSGAQPSLILKVIHDGRALERIDLDEHIGGIKNEPKSSQEDPNAKPAIMVMVKLPSIAIKYLLNIMQMRRVQIKFTQDHDYYTVLSMLSAANCPLGEGSIPTFHRPPSTVSWGLAATAQQTNNPRGVVAAITPESNTPGPSNYMGRNASGFETASNAPQDRLTMQNVDAETEPALGRSLPALQAEAGQATSKQAPSRLSTGPIYHDQELNQMLPPKRDLPFTKLKSMSRADIASRQMVPESSYPEPDNLKRRESFMSESQSQQLIQTQPYPETVALSQESARIQATLPYPGVSTESQQPGPISSVAGAGANKRARTDDGRVKAAIIQAPQSAAWTVSMSVEEQLAEYVKAPTKERAAFLEQWMCELIQDDNFVSLCEDVEGTWRRFAFGVKP